jgi:hypothetical protein
MSGSLQTRKKANAPNGAFVFAAIDAAKSIL